MNWDEEKAQELDPEEEAEISAQVEVWRAAVKKIANANITDDRMLQMLRFSGKFGGDAHQLREDLKKLEGRRNKLVKRMDEHSDYVEGFRSLVEPAPTGFGIPALTAEALGSLNQHGDQLRAVTEAHDALIKEHEALLFQMTSRQRRVESADDGLEGSAKDAQDPPEFDAGRLAEVMEVECGVLVECYGARWLMGFCSALLMAITEHGREQSSPVMGFVA